MSVQTQAKGNGWYHQLKSLATWNLEQTNHLQGGRFHFPELLKKVLPPLNKQTDTAGTWQLTI